MFAKSPPLDKTAILKAMQGRSALYETRTGRQVVGQIVSGMPGLLRDAGWTRVGRQFRDRYDLKQMGLEIVEAQYINGAHPTGRFVDVVVREDYEPAIEA